MFVVSFVHPFDSQHKFCVIGRIRWRQSLNIEFVIRRKSVAVLIPKHRGRRKGLHFALQKNTVDVKRFYGIKSTWPLKNNDFTFLLPKTTRFWARGDSSHEEFSLISIWLNKSLTRYFFTGSGFTVYPPSSWQIHCGLTRVHPTFRLTWWLHGRKRGRKTLHWGSQLTPVVISTREQLVCWGH